jgi:glutamate-1-semialdehyde 2,1-aminomutase
MNIHSKRDAALSEAVDRYIARRPKTQQLHARAKEVMPGGNTRTVLYHPPFPVRVDTAEGARLTDVDGNQYIDFLGEYSAGIYGHSHPRIKQAMAETLETGLNIGAHHGREVAFAETVSRRFDLDLVRFCNSGTEANMMALAAARCFTKRKKIMAFHGGYHGGTLYFTHGASPVNAPYDVVLAPFNDWEGARKIIENEPDLAAAIIEPMQGGGGCIPADPEFLSKLREETEKRGIVLIFDEVMTSRLGPNGLSAILGIEPDLKTLGKYIGGGKSFGAFGGRRDIMSQFDPSRPDALPHAGTFNNNTLTMTVGQAAMTEVFTPEACIALNARGDKLRNDLNEMFMRYQAPMRATGLGSMLAIHPVAREIRSVDDADHADARLRQLLYLDLLEQGIYMADRGFIALSLMVSDEDCSKFISAMERFVERRKEVLK